MYLSALSSSFALVALAEQLGVARHHAQRLLQIVRGDVRELLELGVAAVQLVLVALALGDIDDRRQARAVGLECGTRDLERQLGAVVAVQRDRAAARVVVVVARAVLAGAVLAGAGHDLVDRPADQRVAGLAEQALGGAIDQRDRALAVGHQHAIGRGLDHEAEPLLGAAALGLRGGDPGQIAEHVDRAADLTVVAVRQRGLGLDRRSRAVARDGDHIEDRVDRHALAQQALDQAQRDDLRRAPFAREHVEDMLAARLGVRPAEHALGHLVEPRHPTRGVRGQGSRRRCCSA